MTTEYHCDRCNISLIESDKIPNINKKHGVCGELMRIVRYQPPAVKKKIIKY